MRWPIDGQPPLLPVDQPILLNRMVSFQLLSGQLLLDRTFEVAAADAGDGYITGIISGKNRRL